jgi:uncharacterized protein (TIGR02246 family)
MGIAAVVLIAQLLAPDPKSGEAVVRELLTRYAAAYNDQRLAELAALYRADAMLLPPHSAPIKGREQIHSFWRRYHRFYREDRVLLEADEVKSDGNVAYIAGKRRNGPFSRNFVLCLEKDGEGHWVIAAEIWNESGSSGYQPLPGSS